MHGPRSGMTNLLDDVLKYRTDRDIPTFI